MLVCSGMLRVRTTALTVFVAVRSMGPRPSTATVVATTRRLRRVFPFIQQQMKVRSERVGLGQQDGPSRVARKHPRGDAGASSLPSVRRVLHVRCQSGCARRKDRHLPFLPQGNEVTSIHVSIHYDDGGEL